MVSFTNPLRNFKRTDLSLSLKISRSGCRAKTFIGDPLDSPCLHNFGDASDGL